MTPKEQEKVLASIDVIPMRKCMLLLCLFSIHHSILQPISIIQFFIINYVINLLYIGFIDASVEK